MTDLVVMVGVLFVGWLGHSWFRPWLTCGKCEGNPRNYSSSGRTFNVKCR